jgi:hypothetical protein
MASSDVEEQLRALDFKLGQLKRDYDQYFLGTRPREPVLLRSEVQKLVVMLTNTPFQNTALKFRFNSLCSRYQAQRRQWDETLRKIEAGTYERHRFKAGLRSKGASSAPPPDSGAARPKGDELFQSYVDARLACGQDVKAISKEKLEGVIEKQRAKLQEKFGADANFRFKVAVEDGRAKLKAVRA